MVKNNLWQEFSKGLFKENPIFYIVLGLCPTLAITTSIENALGMSGAVIFVLTFSNVVISAIRKFVPEKIRIPCFIVIIASFVTITELLMQGYFPILVKHLGIFLPLIVVNCIIMGRAEAFAKNNKIIPSLLDGLGMGMGFSLAIILIAGIREFLGTGKILGRIVFRCFSPSFVFVLPPGALLTLGILIALFTRIKKR
ncbi:MAG: electron transport complex subunit E [Candidatus Omnitrophica bacterium]|nr:electron transport complex subunit E [Candidatus Omnitrophota bacterium]